MPHSNRVVNGKPRNLQIGWSLNRRGRYLQLIRRELKHLAPRLLNFASGSQVDPVLGI